MPSFLDDLPLARRALDYARQLHEDQRRDSDAAPFILHPLEVAALLDNTGHREAVVAAGVLHDTVEDTEAGLNDISAFFGAEVAALVTAMTEDASIPDFGDRKAALRAQIAAAGPDATAVYAADKVTKVRELRSRIARRRDLLDEDEDAARKLAHYRQSLEMLEAETPRHPLVRQLHFELEALDFLPPG